MENLMELAEKGLFRVKDYPSAEEYLKDTADTLYTMGYVKKGFQEALLKREQNYPTGLETNTIGVSIPHADIGYAEREMIVVTKFENPVVFKRMDEPDQEIKVSISIMLLLKESHKHLEALKELSSLLMSSSLAKVRDAESMEDFVKVLKEVKDAG